jgi:hypothetical protein
MLAAAGACSGGDAAPTGYMATGGEGAVGAGGVGPDSCGPNRLLCGGVCVPVDVYNCGACDVVCTTGQACVSGTCQCQSPYVDCGNGVCTNQQTDPQNCGACGRVCAADQVCSRGVCTTACDAGLTPCDRACVDLQTDNFNCGACNVVCDVGQQCSGGSCSCTAPLVACGNQCVDLQNDASNCGSCGNVCASGVCQAGACVVQGAGGSGGVVTTAGTGGGGGAVTGGSGGTGGTAGGTVTGGTGGTAGGTVTGGTGGTAGGATGGTAGTAGGATGGTAGTAGGATGGSSGSGGTVNVGDPPGYVRYNDWYGCSWTGVDWENVGSTISPTDFTDRASGEPFCVEGTVGAHPEYKSVALLGFNIHEPPENADCTSQELAQDEEGPPGVVPSGTGVAVNFVKYTATTLRVQIQGPNGHRNDDIGANDRWCYTIEETEGPIFAPYGEFNTECWPGGEGTDWNGEPISAVVFLVPGETDPLDYEFCVDGFADGNSVDDAPPSGMDAPLLSGTLGGTDAGGTTDPDYKRVKVKGDDGHDYIIQNNNWGVPENSEQTLQYEGNSFTIISSTGYSTGEGVPASYPSVYIGANGNVNDGLTTSSDDGLPALVSSISSIQTHLSWSGNGGDYNVSYDVWFANSAPQPGSYDDAISGFVMVWLYKPGGRQPVGSDTGEDFSLGGTTYDIWQGQRSGGGNRPVVSFVAQQTLHSVDFDLMNFIDAAESHGISQSWYLTDIFGGVEIWTGSDAVGVSVDRFTAEVQ